MSMEFYSDEDKYANESFENDTDEIPEISETESESGNEPAVVSSNSTLYAYARSRFNGRKNSLQNKYVVPYYSSSEDDQDVVISETIAEINTEPMCMDDAMKTPKIILKSSLTRRDSLARMSGRHRKLSLEPLSIVEIPNSASNASDNVEETAGEISEHGTDDDDDDVEEEEEKAKSDVEHENDAELLKIFNNLTCVQSDKPLTTLPLAEREETTPTAAIPSSLNQNTVPTIHEDEPYVELQMKINDLNKASTEKPQTVEVHFSEPNIGSECLTEDIEHELVEYEPSIDVNITSETPTSFNSDDYTFHLNFLRGNSSNERFKIRSNQRKSWSFSNDRMREIERHNHILLRKILSQKPTYHLATPKPTKFATLPSTSRTTSAAINRKKKQRQIDLDNQGLKRRIEAITLRRPTLQHLN
ncbi:protein hemingway [Ceratitis capitata]|uniref:protein hemingway n=1 Tax=Ceratitis capitata TaxID=7213 RepID=UPI00032A3B2E|nr:protein hemingway [Ceratitis capitata]